MTMNQRVMAYDFKRGMYNHPHYKSEYDKYPTAKQGKWLECICPVCGDGMELCEAEKAMVCNNRCDRGRIKLHIKDYMDMFPEDFIRR